MSVLLSVVATATPTISPILDAGGSGVVYVTPAWVTDLAQLIKQTAELAILIVPGFLASKLHDFANPKLGRWGNASLLFGYSVLLGVLGLIASDQLNLLTVDWKSPEVVGGAIFTVLGAASARYAAYKARQGTMDAKVAAIASQTAPAQY